MTKIFSLFKRLSKKSLTERELEIKSFIEDRFEFTPRNLEVYDRAFTHKSVVKSKDPNKHNERLEFLGDAIISSIVAEMLFKQFDKATEGELTRLRASIVSRTKLNEIGEKLNFEHLIKYQRTNFPFKSLMGNTVESLVGAIYLDLGYEKAQQTIISQVFEPFLNLDKLKVENKDFKSQLIIYCQKNKIDFSFDCVDEERMENGEQLFSIVLSLNNEAFTDGQAKTKRKAEQFAAELALNKLSSINNQSSLLISNKSDGRKIKSHIIATNNVRTIITPLITLNENDEKNNAQKLIERIIDVEITGNVISLTFPSTAF